MKPTIPRQRQLSGRASHRGRERFMKTAIFRIISTAVAVTSATILVLAAPAWAGGKTVGACAVKVVEDIEDKYGYSSLSDLNTGMDNLEADAKKAFKELESDLERCLEAPNPIIPELDEIIWGGAAFIILLTFMWWKGYPAVRRNIDARAEKISTDLAAAEAAEAQAHQIREHHEVKLTEAKTTASTIIDDARIKADKLGQEMKAKAESEIAEQRVRAEADIEASRRQAIDDLRTEVISIAVTAAERVVSASLDETVHRDLIDSYIDEVAGNTQDTANKAATESGSG